MRISCTCDENVSIRFVALNWRCVEFPSGTWSVSSSAITWAMTPSGGDRLDRRYKKSNFDLTIILVTAFYVSNYPNYKLNYENE